MNEKKSVRFVTPRYEVLFEVPDGACVLYNGERFRCRWLSEYRFALMDEASGKMVGCWHIGEFAEKHNENGKHVVRV